MTQNSRTFKAEANSSARFRDWLLELCIRYHKRRMLAAEVARRAHHDAFMRLIRSRSPEQVRRMERARGLR